MILLPNNSDITEEPKISEDRKVGFNLRVNWSTEYGH